MSRNVPGCSERLGRRLGRRRARENLIEAGRKVIAARSARDCRVPRHCRRTLRNGLACQARLRVRVDPGLARMARCPIRARQPRLVIKDGKRVECTPEERAARHRELIARPAWVMDGMKLGLLRERLVRADTVVYLDLPTRSCLLGIFRRRLRYRGQLRPDLGVYDRINREFLSWVWSFRRRHRPRLLEVLAGFDGRVVVIRRRGDVRRFLDSVGIEPRVVGSTAEPCSDEAGAASNRAGNELVHRRGS